MKDAYKQQLVLQDRMGHTFVPNRLDIPAVKDWILAAHTELSEALQGIPWKPWKNYKHDDYVNVDRQHLLEELIDVQHFLFNAAIHSGFTAEEWQAAWDSKNQQNHVRLETGINKAAASKA